MRILIIAQNCFIGEILKRLAEANEKNIKVTIIVLSYAEKLFMQFCNRNPKIIIETVKAPTDAFSKVYDIFENAHEVQIGMLSKDTYTKLANALNTSLSKFNDKDVDQIWIFNRHTVIARSLSQIPNLAAKVIVFENANVNRGLTIVSDLDGNSVEKLRHEFFDKYEKLALNDLKHWHGNRLFRRACTIFIELRSIKHFAHLTKKLLIKLINKFLFKILHLAQSDIKFSDTSKTALIVMQISTDTEIVSLCPEGNYIAELLQFSRKEIELQNIDHIFVRPHPRDHTFGWLKFYITFKKHQKNISLDLSDYTSCDYGDLRKLITFSSNVLRHDRWSKFPNLKIRTRCNNVQLPKFSQELITVFNGSM